MMTKRHVPFACLSLLLCASMAGGAAAAAVDVSVSVGVATPSAPTPTPLPAAASSEEGLVRTTGYGAVRGSRNASTRTLSWLGVPYASPPVGELRWKATAEPTAWSGVRETRAFGASCSQGARLFSPSPMTNTYDSAVGANLGQPVGAEDCLTLNIWRPDTPTTGLPVIVFIHGGSNVTGYSADPIYDGATLARKANAVVVTLNYRLGLLGWLDLAQLKIGEPRTDSGNFGTLDQIQALSFVKRNIAAFDGNPANVTVMGESAGAVNVWAMMISPLARGLMHKAVSMSGGLVTKSPMESRNYAQSLLRALLVDDGKAADATQADLLLLNWKAEEVATYLRSKTAVQIIRVAIANKLPDAPAVLLDGNVIPAVPQLAIATGAYNRVPMLATNTLDEGKLFGATMGAYKPSDRDRLAMMDGFDPNAPTALTAADFIQPQYLPVDAPVTGWNDVSRTLTTGLFWSMTQNSLSTLATAQPGQIWYARFDWRRAPAPFADVYGAAHALDLPFWFGNFGRSLFSFAFGDANRAGREQLSDAMARTLGSFAATGRPSHTGFASGEWAPWPAGLLLDAGDTTTHVRSIPVVLP